MKVVALTRDFGGGLQGKLNGGYTLTNWMLECVPEGAGAFLVEVPGASYGGEGTFPELDDLYSYGRLWEAMRPHLDADVVLCQEYAMFPWLKMMGANAWLLVHSHHQWNDGTAHILRDFLPFISRAVVPTAYTWGVASELFEQVVYLPYPVDDSLFYPEVKEDYVIWVGREGYHKGSDQFHKVVRDNNKVKFKAYSSTPLPGFEDLSNVELCVKRPREECVEAIRKAKTLLMTSNQEVYATCLIEAGLSGCNVIAPRIFGCSHVDTLAHMYLSFESDSVKAYRKINEYLSSELTPSPSSLWQKAFGVHSLRARWQDFYCFAAKVQSNEYSSCCSCR